MFGFTNDAIISILRHMLTFLGGWVVAKGWLSADVANQLIGAIVTIVGILFGQFFHAQSNGAIKTKSVTPNAEALTNVTN